MATTDYRTPTAAPPPRRQPRRFPGVPTRRDTGNVLAGYSNVQPMPMSGKPPTGRLDGILSHLRQRPGYDTGNILNGQVMAPGAEQQAEPFPSFGFTGGGGGGGGGGGSNSYDSAFQASLAKSRASIEAQFRNALDEVNRSEAVQQQMVGQLPGQYSQLHGQATEQNTQLGQQAEAAQAQAGVQSYTPAGSMMAPLQGAMNMAQSTQQAGVPLLQLGVTDQAARTRGGLGQAKFAARDQLDAEERSANMQRAERSAASGRDNSLAMAKMAYEQQVEQFKLNREDKQRQEDIDITDRRRREDRDWGKGGKAGKTTFSPLEVSMARGEDLRSSNPNRLRTLQANSAYGLFTRDLMDKPVSDLVDLEARVRKFRKKYPKAGAAALSLAAFDALAGSSAASNTGAE